MSFFPESRGAQINGGTFVSASHSSNVVVIQNQPGSQVPGSGFEKLVSVALEQALRDSSAWERHRCLPGTRTDYLRNLTNWGNGEWESRRARVFWMDGPAGVGKSAIAQTWSDKLEDKLAAAFFFSRANGWNQPEKFWPTISYQLSTRYPSYRSAVDATIIRDPLVLSKTKSMDAQFQELMVKPLREMSIGDREAIQDTIIVVDGLDECNSQEAQRVIIDVVMTSVVHGTSSFLWAFFTRPEPHIVSAFSSGSAPEVCWHMTLPIRTRDSKRDIRAFLEDRFRTMRVKYDFLDASWPSETAIGRLVELSDGLFAYSSNAIRFIDEGPESYQAGPEERLQALLTVGTGPRAQLPGLDQLYLLIMDQIPKAILPTTLLILCAHLHVDFDPHDTSSYTLPILSSLLDLSTSTILTAVRTLHSVLEVTGKSRYALRYHHASFTDFLTTPERATSEYCINELDIFRKLYSACIDAACRPLPHNIVMNPFYGKIRNDEDIKILVYAIAIDTLIELPKTIFLSHNSRFLPPELLMKLESINWTYSVDCFSQYTFDKESIEHFFNQIPSNWRNKIIYPTETWLTKAKRKVIGRRSGIWQGYIVGIGVNRVWLKPDVDEDYKFLAYHML